MQARAWAWVWARSPAARVLRLLRLLRLLRVSCQLHLLSVLRLPRRVS